MGHGENVQFAVSGGTPGGDSNDYKLFDSTVAFGVGSDGDARNHTLFAHDISRIQFTVKNSQAGTLTAYYSQNKGTTWTAYDVKTVVIAPSNQVNGPYDYQVDWCADWKLVWTNGGVAQATWIPALSGIRNYHGAAV